MKKKVEIVSLGTNCMPRTFLTKNKIKPSKAQGELSCPFDLVKHPIESVLLYLQNNFANYTDDLFFVLRKRNFLDFRGKGLWQKPDGTVFFHDKDCKANDLDKLKTRIENRIKNFQNIMDSETPILFVIFVFEKTEFVEKIFDALKEIRKDKAFALAVLNFSNSIIEPQKGIYSLNLVPPCQNYHSNWNKRKIIRSKKGQYIEECIFSFVKSILDKNF